MGLSVRVDSSEHDCIEVDVTNSVAYLIWTYVFKWYVVWCVSKNGNHKDMCLKETGLRAQTKTTILSSILSTSQEKLI